MPKNDNWTILKIVILIWLALGVAALVYWYWWQFLRAPVEPAFTVNTRTSPSSADVYHGWLEYKSPNYGYSLKHPEDTLVQRATVTDIAELQVKGDDVCASVKTKYGFVTLLTKDAVDKQITCGYGGVASGFTPFTEEVIIMDKTYTAEGKKYKGADTNLDNEFLLLKLDNGYQVKYGLLDFDPNDATTSYKQAKEEVLNIVRSLKY